MPPAKRRRTRQTAAAPASESAPQDEASSTNMPPAQSADVKQEAEDAKVEGDGTSSRAGTEVATQSEDGSVTNDLALLDEEEIPDEADLSQPPTPPPGGAEEGQKDHAAQPRRYHAGYNELKTFHGQYYSGMAVGGSHTWNYDPGVWRETKEEPDLWKIDYRTNKRRARKAPQGSGAPVGTEYHWLIVAHQYVKKVDANTYETHLVGSKYKLAHKAANATAWSVPTVKAQREREIELLDHAKRRVQGLPPVLAGEKVRVERHEKGQRRLEDMFAGAGAAKKRKAESEVDGGQ
ncbi:hypothetical protein VTK73DRAFT_7938 [Phialemonium thermophilum]|uniref:Uncharacterized protein n=1 Tax=Phialemonium thermophilum TaxID=223376 RepID=A0ABR3WBN3_9PEZI